MDRICHVALLAAFVVSGPSVAQTDNPFNGTWTVSFDGKKTADRDGSVVIKDNSGVWDIAAQSRNNPCLGREYPITVKRSGPDELVFTVNRAATMAGCRDSTYTFKKVDDKTLKGEVGEGRTASLIRK